MRLLSAIKAEMPDPIKSFGKSKDDKRFFNDAAEWDAADTPTIDPSRDITCKH